MYAIKHMIGDVAETAEDRARNALCADLLLLQPAVRVSTIAWMEVLWTFRAEEWKAAKEKIEPLLYDDTLTLEAASLATEIAREERKLPDFCPKCWGSNAAKPCTRCNRIGCREDRRNDLLILATAVCAGVETLYTFDGGHHHFAGKKVVRGLKILRPEPSKQVTIPVVDLGPESRVEVVAPGRRSRPRKKG